MDLWDVDIRRVMPFQAQRRYLHDRTVEALGLLYAMHWPYRQPETARGVRRSRAARSSCRAGGACFGEVAGWERANWFAPEGVEPSTSTATAGRTGSATRPNEHHRRAHRSRHCSTSRRSASSLCEGPDAEAVLNRICANDVAVPVGKIVYTQWLNERGGIEADLTVTREAATAT